MENLKLINEYKDKHKYSERNNIYYFYINSTEDTELNRVYINYKNIHTLEEGLLLDAIENNIYFPLHNESLKNNLHAISICYFDKISSFKKIKRKDLYIHQSLSYKITLNADVYNERKSYNIFNYNKEVIYTIDGNVIIYNLDILNKCKETQLYETDAFQIFCDLFHLFGKSLKLDPSKLIRNKFSVQNFNSLIFNYRYGNNKLSKDFYTYSKLKNILTWWYENKNPLEFYWCPSSGMASSHYIDMSSKILFDPETGQHMLIDIMGKKNLISFIDREIPEYASISRSIYAIGEYIFQEIGIRNFSTFKSNSSYIRQILKVFPNLIVQFSEYEIELFLDTKTLKQILSNIKEENKEETIKKIFNSIKNTKSIKSILNEDPKLRMYLL